MINNELIESALSSIELGFWRWNIETDDVCWDSDMYKIFDIEKENFKNNISSFFDLLHSEDKVKIFIDVENCKKNNLNYEGEFRIYDKNKNIKQIYAKGNFECNKDGNKKYMIGVCLDVTRYTSIQNQINKLSIQIECVFESLNIGFWSWDLETNKIYGDKKMYQLFNSYGSLENFYNSIHPDDLDMVKKATNVENIIKNNGNYFAEYRLFNNDTINYYLGKGKLFFGKNNNPKYMVGIVLDQTEQKKIIEELISKNEELKRFSYMCSHDLQEPLRKVRNYLSLINFKDLKNTPLEDIEKYYERIDFCIDNMQNFINDLLIYSRIDNSCDCCELLDLNRFLEELKEEYKNTCAINFELEKIKDIFACKLSLLQIFNNLISNSIKFKKENSSCVISIKATRENNKITFLYKDSGIGIDPRFISRVFEPFTKFHSKTKYPGNGMGMYIIKKILEKNDGAISVESSFGEWTEFKFTFFEKEKVSQ